MLSFDTARKIGINACINKLGREFVLAHRDNASSAWGNDEMDGGMYCYVGVSDVPPPETEPGVLVLDSETKFPYHASCIVNLESGALTFLEAVCPAVQ